MGTIATGALIAREVDRAQAGRPAEGHEGEPCANCGALRLGPYCHRCGQAGHVHRHIGALAHDIAHGVFHFEGRVWHTLPLLAWRPGELTRRYVQGERARFVSPMALFLFSVFLMFAVVSSLAGHADTKAGTISLAVQLAQERTKLAQLEARESRETDADDRARLDKKIASQREDVEALDKLVRGGVIAQDALGSSHVQVKKWNADTGWAWLDKGIEHASENPALLLYKLKMDSYKYSWALIPISLPFIWLLFAFRRDVGLYDHAIFSIYSLSFMSLGVVSLVLLGAIGLPTAIIVLSALFIPPIHMYRQLKGAYRLGWFGAGWRTIALLMITVITSALFFAFIFYMTTD